MRGSQAGGFTSDARLDDAPRVVTDAASLVDPLPGVHVRRLGGDDAFATISVRGASSSQVTVVLAGIPLTGGADPSLDLSSLPLWPDARARVYRSFTPAMLGPASLGGTLVLDGPRPQGDARSDVWAAAGAFGARRLRVGDVRTLGATSASPRIALAVTASRADDDFSYLDPLASTPGHDVFATRKNAGHAAAAALASVVVPVGESGGTLSATAIAQARRQHLPGTVKAPTPFASLASSRLAASVELARPLSLRAGTTFFGKAWGRREVLHATNASGSVTLGPSASDDAFGAIGGSLGVRLRRAPAHVDVRVDGSGEAYAPSGWVGALQPDGASRGNAGGGVDVEARPTSFAVVSASARADAWRDASGGSGTTTFRATGHGGVELSEGAIAFAVHGGRLARPASFVERFGNRGAFVGEPSLRPEGAWTADAGVRATARGPGRWIATFEAAAFSSWAEDLIVYVYAGAYGQARATNIGRSRTAGVEATAEARAGSARFRASYTFLDPRNLTACESAGATCIRPKLPGKPAHDLVVDGAYPIGPAVVRYGVDVVSGMTTDTVGSVVVPPRVLQTVGLSISPPNLPEVRVGVDVRNLFDVRVASYDGVLGPVRVPIGDAFEYPLAGRNALVTIQFVEKSQGSGDKAVATSARGPKTSGAVRLRHRATVAGFNKGTCHDATDESEFE